MTTGIRLLVLSAALLIILGAASAENPANPVLADWNAPALSYTAKGSGNAQRGYLLADADLDRVMSVTPKSGGWSLFVAPVSGVYSFSVDTDQLRTNTLTLYIYRAEGDLEDLQQTDRLSYRKNSGIVTQAVSGVLMGETIYWKEDAGGSDPYLLMVSTVDWTGEKQDDVRLPETVEEAPEADDSIEPDDELTGQPILDHTPRAGEKFLMGWYEQDGFPDGRERIEWTVLEVNEKKDMIFVISSKALDCILYHPTRAVVSWGDSYIRNWLMYDFAYSALSPEEQECIVPVEVAGVTDTVTMLDEKQIKKYKLDQNGCDVSDYARYYISPSVSVKNDHGCWWVRMDRTYADYKNQFVGRGGKVYGGSNRGGNYTTTNDNGVRPAMYLSLSALRQCRLGNDFSMVVGTAVNASNPSVRLGGVSVTVNGRTFVTNDQGKFFFSLGSGTYHYTARRDGYIPAEGDVTVRTGKNDLTVPMSRLMAYNEYRVVLTWGEKPYDLDSHLNGVAESGRAYHIAYYHLTADGGNALLEWDDITSYGPETIHFIAYAGESYVYSIHDFTNRGSSRSNWMGSSGARVTVYRGNAEIGSFTVPAGSGTVWNVFRVDDNELTPLNTVGFCSNPEDVGVGIR